jgi:branched-chain amino acid transport system ATP-binding protein
MVAVGRALMTNPELLILARRPRVSEIWRCLAALKADGQAILVIDKNVAPLKRLADRHYILEKGRVVWSGSSAALSASPEVQHAYLGV